MRSLLLDCPIPRDALPYTPQFSELKKQYSASTKSKPKDSEFWQAISSIGKGGGASKGVRKSAPRTPPLSPEQQLELLRLFPDGIGARDRLPYTDEFDRLHRQYGQRTGHKLTKHEFWRAVSRVAKLSRKPKPIYDAIPKGRFTQSIVDPLEISNPWWLGRREHTPERFRRWGVSEVMRRLESRTTPVVAIRGPRQVGKTTIQRQLIEQLLWIDEVPPQRILRVQFDQLSGLGSLKDPLIAIVRWYEQNILGESINALSARNEYVYLFLDELQNLEGWDAQLKFIADHYAARIVATGSSALRIARGRDSLAGRISLLELGPLRLHEIAGIAGLGSLPPFAGGRDVNEWVKREFWIDLANHAKKHRRVLGKAFDRFSKLGGYPICHKADVASSAEFAPLIVDTVLKKTIEQDVRVGPKAHRRDPRLLEETFRLICRYAGQDVRSERIAEELEQVLQSGITPAKINDAIQFFEDSMLIHRISPLEMRLKPQARTSKLCICDHFVRNAFLRETVPLSAVELSGPARNLSDVAGHIIESVIGYFLKGIGGLDVSWFPGPPEVDLVLTLGLRRIPIEVKYVGRNLKSSDLRGIGHFCDKSVYGADFGLILTRETHAILEGGHIALPVPALLLLH